MGLRITEAIAQIVEGKDLSEYQMEQVMEEIMEGQATSAQIASFLTALRIKGETVGEVVGAAKAIRRKAIRIDARSRLVVDTCGTGGDGIYTFNISTASAFVVAASGVTVAKHGNRAVSSRCGSADVLEALGVKLDVGPEVIEECLQEIGIGFLFAPTLHPAMRYAATPRKEMGIRTIFNVVGPLTNPAGATCQLVGVYEPSLTETIAHVLRELGVRRAIVVHGMDGLDEATISCETRISELKDGSVRTYNLDPRHIFGRLFPLEDLLGGDPWTNAEIIRNVLEGKDGAPRKVVELNAGLALLAAGRAKDVREGVNLASDCIQRGKALEKLESLIAITNS